jgi:hypothetical protein
MCDLKLYSKIKSFECVGDEGIVEVYSVKNIGDVVSKKRSVIAEDHRISIDLSHAEWDEFKVMVSDAESVLETHMAYLKKVMVDHHVHMAYIDFPLYSRLAGVSEIVNQNDMISAK